MKDVRYFVGDFETTVYDGQESTEVWASACVELFTEDVIIFHSIAEQYMYLESLKQNIVIYYHNLKFDGAFWLSYLMTELKYEMAYESYESEYPSGAFFDNKQMKNKTFKYVISDMGQWYSITIKVNDCLIEIRDSLKLLPFSVKRIGNSFDTKHKKLEMEYKGYRYAGCVITDEEKKYIANDVLVVKEALEIMFNEGHNKLTIGSCCLAEYKRIIGRYDWGILFPDLVSFELNKEEHRYANADEWIRKSYRGGWCYLVRGKENQIKTKGTTADVNSLYPSMMSKKSGNKYPYGNPCFWTGNFIPPQAIGEEKYFFVRVRTRFYLRSGYLPFIQIKGNPLYCSTESLETSDIWSSEQNCYCQYYLDKDGNKKPTTVELTLTMTDYYLIKEHYELVDFEILDGCWFYTQVGIFDEYIEPYKKTKQESKGAKRELAKLFLNNLYGKMASNTNSSFKLAYVREDESIGFTPVFANDKKAGYIAIGSAITSYAREFTIRAAQKNYYGVEERGFIYADTDSIHCDLAPEEIKGIEVHDTEFCCWKLEACWDIATFTRQKTYIEHVTHEDLHPIDNPYYNVKCAGMPQKCKDLFVKSISGITKEEIEQGNYTEEEKKFLSTPRTIEDFKRGLVVPSKLMPKRIKGGIILVDTTYEMR